jgi:hypothetical protein
MINKIQHPHIDGGSITPIFAKYMICRNKKGVWQINAKRLGKDGYALLDQCHFLSKSGRT